MKRLLLFTFILITGGVLGQITFEKKFDFTRYSSSLTRKNFILPTNNTGYLYVNLHQSSYPYFDTVKVRITKLDEQGNIEWAKFIDDTDAFYSGQSLRSAQFANDSGLIITGNVDIASVSGGNEIFVIKTDKYCNPEWGKYLIGVSDQDRGGNVIQMDNGDILFASNYDQDGEYVTDCSATKLDSVGNLLWSKGYSSNMQNWGVSTVPYLLEVSPTKYLLAGRAKNTFNYSFDIYILTIDADGNPVHSIFYSGEGDEQAISAVKLDSSQIVVLGYTDSYGVGSNDIFLMNIDTLGNQNWFYTYGTDQDETPVSMTINNYGNLVISGWLYNPAEAKENSFLMEVNNNGDLVWSSIYTDFESHISSVKPTTDGGYIASGYIDSYLSYSPFREYILKTNSTGHTKCNEIPYPLIQQAHFPSMLYTSPIVTEDGEIVDLDLSYNSYNISLNTICFDSCQVIAQYENEVNRVCLGESLELLNTSNNAIEYNWFVNNDLVSNDVNFTFDPETAGNYYIKLVASDLNCSDSCSSFIFVDSLPEANFGFERSLFVVNFSNLSSGAYGWQWDFDDGSFSYEKHTEHVFPSFGSYEVSLKAFNRCDTSIITKTIVIEDTVKAAFQKFLDIDAGFVLDVVQCKDGGYAITGLLFDSYDRMFLTKTDIKGNVLWSKKMGTYDYHENGRTVIECHDLGYILLDHRFYDDDANIVRTDRDGEILWTKEFNNAEIYDVVQTDDLQYIVTGELNNCLFVVKMNARGNVVWMNKYLGAHRGYKILKLDNDEFIITGYSSPLGKVNLTKIDADGNLIWSQNYFITQSLYARSLCIASNGDYLIAGSYPDADGIFAMRIDTLGQFIWFRKYTTQYTFNDPVSIYEDTNGVISLVAENQADVVLIRLNQDGNIQSSIKLWNNPDWGAGLSGKGCKTADNGLIIPYCDGDDNGYLFKINENGTTGCNEEDLFVGFSPMSVSTENITTDSIQPVQNEIGWDYFYNSSYDVYDTVVCYCDNLTGLEADFAYLASASTVSFTDLSNNAEYWFWEFGDGNTSELQNPIHTYETAGIYNVCLTATNACSSDSTCQTIEVDCPLPTSFFTYEDSLNYVQFYDNSMDATSWYWDFGDGQNSNEQNPYHIYISQDTFNVCLIASNDCGPDTVCQSLSINCPAPVANFTYTDSLYWVDFYDLSIGAVDWYWDFGDYNYSTLPNPFHIYDDTGQYIVSLNVNNLCGYDTYYDTLEIICPLPIADFFYESSGLTVNFYDQSTNADNYAWHFGDGSYSTEQNPVHTYENAGDYIVSFTTSNFCGVDQKIDTITITETVVINNIVSNGVTIEPNPFVDYTNISFYNPELSKCLVKVFDQKGNLVLEKSNLRTNKIQIERRSLEPGLYLFTVRKENGKNYFGKFVIQ